MLLTYACWPSKHISKSMRFKSQKKHLKKHNAWKPPWKDRRISGPWCFRKNLLGFSSKIHGHPPAGRRRHLALMQCDLVELQPAETVQQKWARIARSNDLRLKSIWATSCWNLPLYPKFWRDGDCINSLVKYCIFLCTIGQIVAILTSLCSITNPPCLNHNPRFNRCSSSE